MAERIADHLAADSGGSNAKGASAKPGKAQALNPPRGFKPRVLTSLVTLVGFLIMTVSGLVAYFQPQGRVAYWTDWTFWGLSKTTWGDIHIISSIMFLVGGAFHIYFNWNAIVNYLSAKAAGALKYGRELTISLLIGLWVVVSGIWALPPLDYISQFSEFLKDSWVTSPEYEPPFGHAELVSLKVLCKRMGIDPARAQEALKAKGIAFGSAGESVLAIARKNHVSPM